MNSLLADPRKNRTQQQRFQARLKIRSHVHNLKHKCKACRTVKLKKHLEKDNEDTDKDSDGEYLDKTDEDSISEELEENCEEVDDMTKVKGSSSSHCHCDLFQVDDDFKVFMSNGQPYRRWKKEVDDKRITERDNQRTRQVLRQDQDTKYKADLKTELIMLRKKLREDMREKSKKVPRKPLTTEELKEQRMQRKRDLEEQREERRKKLFPVLDN